MVAFPIDDDAIAGKMPAELEIRRVTDATGIDVHCETLTAGFGSHPAVASGTTCLDLIGRPGCVVYVGYADGQPVVSGLGWRTGRTIGVFSIATIESARRRGFGTAMTARVVRDGVAAGCDVAALQASEMGRPIYERLGFRSVVTYVAYVEGSVLVSGGGDRRSAACAPEPSDVVGSDIRDRPSGRPAARGLLRVHRDRRHLGAPAPVPGLRADELLRHQPEPARHGPLPRDGPSDDPVR